MPLVWFYQQVLRRLTRIIALCFFLAAYLLPFGFHGGTSSAAPVDERIRIAIVKGVASVTVDGEGLLALRDNGQPLAFSLPLTVRVAKDGVSADSVTSRRLTFSSPAAVIVNGKPYRGVVEIMLNDKGILVINDLPLEEYLVGLINCEISSAWPIEAVKAQAVIARTYALNRREARKNHPYHLESSVIDQVYDGCAIEDSRARRGVSETAGEVLTYGGAIIQAFYHSNCGGWTESSENVWGTPLPYLKGVDCQYCLSSPATVWDQKLPLKDIEERLKAAGHKVALLVDIRGGKRSERGRWKNIVLVMPRGDLSISGDQFRKAVGYGVIKSTNFAVKVAGGEARFAGAGNGHGVGLCQWGAKQRALEGFSYTEILSYYYPGTALSRPEE